MVQRYWKVVIPASIVNLDLQTDSSPGQGCVPGGTLPRTPPGWRGRPPSWAVSLVLVDWFPRLRPLSRVGFLGGKPDFSRGWPIGRELRTNSSANLLNFFQPV